MREANLETICKQRYFVTGSMQNQDLEVLEVVGSAYVDRPSHWQGDGTYIELALKSLKTSKVKYKVHRVNDSGNIYTPGVDLNEKYMAKVAAWKEQAERLLASCRHVEETFFNVSE